MHTMLLCAVRPVSNTPVQRFSQSSSKWTTGFTSDHGANFKVPLASILASLYPLLPTHGGRAEWKVDMDSPTDTHRHLSHLIGLYPGYAVTSFNTQYQQNAGNLTRDEVIAAAQTSLIHRGNGTGPDADAGWEKVWRAACWAQLGNASEFYHELSVSEKALRAPVFPPV